MTAPREIIPGRFYFLTRRTTQRQFLLRPDGETTRIFAYCLAEAAQRCEIDLVAWLAMSNHYHAVVHDPKGRLPEFIERLHKMVAKVLNEHRDRRENLWSSEAASVIYLPTPADIFDKVVYTLTNPIADDLVDRVTDWPGCSSLRHLVASAAHAHPRPRRFFAPDGTMPEAASLRVVVPSGARVRESVAAWSARVLAAVAAREKNLREARLRENRRILGRKGVLRMSPFDVPRTIEARHRGAMPCVACKDPERRQFELDRLERFRASYADARRLFASGKHKTVFPSGTYRLRTLGARCEAFPPAPT